MKNVIQNFLQEGYLVSPDFLDKIKTQKINQEEIVLRLQECTKGNVLILSKDIVNITCSLKKNLNLNWTEFEKSKAHLEKGFGDSLYENFLKVIYSEHIEKIEPNKEENTIEKSVELEEKENGSNFVIVKNYLDVSKKREIQDFVKYFKLRYNFLKDLLINRPELNNILSINRIKNKDVQENVSLIGLVYDKRITKNGNILLSVEDLSGTIPVVISKNNRKLFEIANDLVLDEVVGICGTNGKNIMFTKNILYPDISLNNEFKKLDRDEYIVFTSDMHLGSKMFLEKEFLNFIDWLNGNYGDEKQKEIAKKVKFVFISGDLVEGVGIYPGQEEDLLIKDVYKQYEILGDHFGKIRKDINLIMIGGNHDALRLAEPQPILDKKIGKPLYDLENVTMVSNPSTINIFSSKNFPGFNILMYHGFSFPYLADNVDSIVKSGRLDRADLIMKQLLQKRHLAPTHESTQYIPDTREDFLVIDKIPDFFVSGHIHKTTSMNYRGVTLLGAGCWTKQTKDQEKRGIVPDPGKVFVVNLRTREFKILNFYEDGN
ncbi:metallophosphoesterase [bacterium]|nr:metallophosphoesterase [bacterium]